MKSHRIRRRLLHGNNAGGATREASYAWGLPDGSRIVPRATEARCGFDYRDALTPPTMRCDRTGDRVVVSKEYGSSTSEERTPDKDPRSRTVINLCVQISVDAPTRGSRSVRCAWNPIKTSAKSTENTTRGKALVSPYRKLLVRNPKKLAR